MRQGGLRTKDSSDSKLRPRERTNREGSWWSHRACQQFGEVAILASVHNACRPVSAPSCTQITRGAIASFERMTSHLCINFCKSRQAEGVESVQCRLQGKIGYGPCYISADRVLTRKQQLHEVSNSSFGLHNSLPIIWKDNKLRVHCRVRVWGGGGGGVYSHLHHKREAKDRSLPCSVPLDFRRW